MRHRHEIPGFRRRDGGELFPHALGEGGLAADEYRHVSAQAQPQRRQVVEADAQAPEVIQAEQGSGGIRAAATDATAHGQALGQPEVGALAGTACFLQQASRAQDEILFGGDARQAVAQV
ncbi:hypothetical protein A4V15_08630 [Pseudomonas oryzihabitans]|uniref:Uncharacterized protein n=1 Tax=Pseudomonas oryzihabitans TaxID=47885 RepID=A0A178L4I7_9PSED|nr:hypothetical protein A4V15_08630 [Pseudomonas oryzihabitans]